MLHRQLLEAAFQAAVGAADPLAIVPQHLPSPPKGQTLVVGAGKAAASMALAVERGWPAGASLEGLVITRYLHGGLPGGRIRVIEAGHPVPDEAGAAAAGEILERAGQLGPEDLLLVLVSGGGSALLSLPADGIAMAELSATTRALLRCGAPIQEMNTVRKHLSRIQGGRLAAATRAKVVALVISDVTGDDPTHIASGPCAPDPSTFQDALDILAHHGVNAPAAVVRHLNEGVRGALPETAKPGDPLFARVENRVIATAQNSLQAAARIIREHGIPAVVLGDAITGEARDVARVHAALVRQILRHDEPWMPPVALLSGGECTVTVRDASGKPGRGGRCTEYLLALALELEALGCDPARVEALAADTDGIDGTEDNAGGVFGKSTLGDARSRGVDPRKSLERNDAYSVFAAAESLIVTGPTRTNVNDFRVILIH